ncbi:MAG: carboxypeptidase-like regulatory domain-containing protein, partial [Bryobacteraceae bacterium]
MRFLLFLCAALPAIAQLTTSSISGYVFDPTGRPISGASIEATQTAKGLIRRVNTSAKGFYVVAELPPAAYTISASAPNFETVRTEPAPLAGVAGIELHSDIQTDAWRGSPVTRKLQCAGDLG